MWSVYPWTIGVYGSESFVHAAFGSTSPLEQVRLRENLGQVPPAHCVVVAPPSTAYLTSSPP